MSSTCHSPLFKIIPHLPINPSSHFESSFPLSFFHVKSILKASITSQVRRVSSCENNMCFWLTNVIQWRLQPALFSKYRNIFVLSINASSLSKVCYLNNVKRFIDKNTILAQFQHNSDDMQNQHIPQKAFHITMSAGILKIVRAATKF